MNRRDFLRTAVRGLALPIGLPAVARPAAPRNVIVIGAGLAGLVAGHELLQAGHDVTVVEARDRPGGRIQTLRVFDDGLHAEAGALFVPDNHDLTLRYANRVGLALEPAAPPFEARLFYARGQRIVANWGGSPAWPFDLTAEDRELGAPALWQKYVDAGTSGVSRAVIDGMSAAQFLRSRGASPEAIALLRLGFLDMVGDGIESYSALQMQERVRRMPSTVQRFLIAGGSDRLPNALAADLNGRVRYNSPVDRIEYGKTSATVSVGGSRQSADHVICTVPFSVLRGLDIDPPLSAGKAQAVSQLPYTSVVRVLLQFRQKFWTAENLFLLTTTDLPIKWIYEHTVNQAGPRGILEAQALGADARRLAQLPEAARIDFALAQIEKVFPAARSHYERGTCKIWDDDIWAQGAFAYFRPGQMTLLMPHLARPEGRLHFAGDHTSSWPGWMQGAIESGIRAALEIGQA